VAAVHIALLNVARMVAPLDSPQLAGFMAGLDPINALADTAPGFVWRHEDENGNSTSVRILGDDDLIINLAVWESVAALKAFTYSGAHLDFLRRRREWFSRMAEPYLVLWPVTPGHLPSIEESEAKLLQIRADGPTPEVFTFTTVPHALGV
jgi:hypothetical protein